MLNFMEQLEKCPHNEANCIHPTYSSERAGLAQGTFNKILPPKFIFGAPFRLGTSAQSRIGRFH